MTDDAFTMSMRKFLKQVGVTSQQEIEAAVRAANSSGPVTIRATITCEAIGLEHVVEGTVQTGGGEA